MKHSLHKLRLHIALITILLCNGLVWATTESTTGAKTQPLNVESKSALGMSVGELTVPVVPDWSQYAEDYVANGKTAYYLYNVGCGQFVTGANSWATQISLGTGALPYMALVVESMSVSDEAVYPGAVKLKVHGTYTFYGYNGRENGFAIGNTYLFRDSETSGFIDRYQQPVWYWNFEKTANGNYYWHSAYGMASFDAANQFAKCDGAGQPVFFNGTSVDSNNEWAFIPYTAYLLYKARIALYDKLMEASENGISIDKAAAMYNNADATIEDIQEAYRELASELTRLAVSPLMDQSSEDNPIDITQYTIVNPDFEDGQSPWTITEGMGQNLQVQSVTYTNGDVTIRNFIEAWYPIEVGSLKDGVICQTVIGLPKGRYCIEADVMAVRQEDGFPKASQQGIYLFYNNGEYTVHSESLSTGNGAPEHFSFDFDYAGAEQMTIGLMAESTNCNWMGMDNFRLYAIGQMKNDPARQALADAIAIAETASAKIGNNDITDTDGMPLNASAAAKSGCMAALAAAKKALEAGSGYPNAIDALATATDELNASAEIYAKYQAIWQNATEKQEWLTEKGQWSALTGQIAAFANNINDGFNSGTLDGTTFENVENAVDNMITQHIATAGAVQPGDDLTLIVKNADFSEGGGVDLTGTAVPGWNIVRGGITELSANYHDIEAYHRTFDFQQTLAYNLPAGTYRITVQGFVRVDEGNNSMVLYAGASERQFKLITNENSDTQICGDGTGSTAWPYDVENPVLGGYIPYSMQGAMMYFETVNPATGLPYYLNDVTIAHTGGPLTIGVKCDDAGLWILWDNFTLKYVNDNPLTPIFDDIDALAGQLTAIVNEYKTLPEEIREVYYGVMARVNNKENITSIDDANALIDDLKAKIQMFTPIESHLSFEQSSFGVNLGNVFVAPTLTNPYNLTVTYTSDNTDIVAANANTGEVIIKGEGKATISATILGGWNYKPNSASYSISVQVLKTHLCVWTKDGGKTIFALSKRPMVTFTETGLLIKGEDIDVAYDKQDVLRFTYEEIDVATAITDIATEEPTFRQTGDCLLFSDLKPNSVVSIHTLNGMLVCQKTVRTPGEYSFPISDLKAGVYVVTVNGQTYKIMKR